MGIEETYDTDPDEPITVDKGTYFCIKCNSSYVFKVDNSKLLPCKCGSVTFYTQ